MAFGDSKSLTHTLLFALPLNMNTLKLCTELQRRNVTFNFVTAFIIHLLSVETWVYRNKSALDLRVGTYSSKLFVYRFSLCSHFRVKRSLLLYFNVYVKTSYLLNWILSFRIILLKYFIVSIYSAMHCN